MTATVTQIDRDAGRDPRIEAWLNDHHVQWEWDPAIPLDRIDMRRSLNNQARPGEALLEDNVELCIKGFLDGNTLPPIVVRRTTPKAKLTVTDGNHRTTAALDPRVAYTSLPGYIYTAADETALVMSYTCNMTHGAQLTRQQRIVQAVHLVETGMPVTRAARLMGVDEVGVSNQRTLNRAATRAATLKVTGFNDLPQGQRLALAVGFAGDDDLFTAATALVRDAAMTATECKELIRIVKAPTTAAGRLEVIDQQREALRVKVQKNYGGKTTASRPRRQSEHDRLMITLASIQSIRPVDVDESAPGPNARKRLRVELKKATAHMIAIDKAVS